MSVELAAVLQAEAWRLQDAWKLDDAAARLRDAIRAAREDGARAILDTANLLNDLAEVEYERGSIRRAYDLARRALTLAGAVASGDLAATRIRLRAMERAAAADRALGRYLPAEQTLRTGIELAAAAFGDGSFEQAQMRNQLGVLYKYWGRWDESLALYRGTLQTVLASSGEHSDAAASVYHNIGGVLHARGDYAAAEPPARKAWMIARALHGDTDVEAERHAVAYAAVLDGLGRREESVTIFRAAIAVFEQRLGPGHPEVGATLHNLGAALAACGAREEAEACYRRTLAITETTIGPNAPEAALTRQNLGALLCSCGRGDEGLPLIRVALAALEASFAGGHPWVVAAKTNLNQHERE